MISLRARRTLGVLAAGLTAVVLAACAPVEAETTDPIATTTPLASPTATTQLTTTTVMIGDSIMSGYGLETSQAWPALLADTEPLQLTNLACGGTGFVAVGDCGTDYAGFIPAVAALAPQLVVIESSSNDFDLPADQIAVATEDTVQQLHDAAPYALIVGLSTIWNDDTDVPGDVDVTSAALEQALDEVDGVFIDVGQPLAGHPEWMQDDDVHPTAAGQRVIAAVVAAKLKAAGVLG
ncbi:MAG: SGNH/GDSL hydrolase family protein [Microbacterium sp.]|uniref:SGNH/GDSL hydrolase family protein n=1 Tax=Microbacterium sp. TaxID=51671 RepID=UPI0039E2B875